MVVTFAALGLLAGAAYSASAVPLFTATANLLVDDRAIRAVQDFALTSTSMLPGEAAIESQVEVLKSEQVRLSVVDKLGLGKPSGSQVDGGGADRAGSSGMRWWKPSSWFARPQVAQSPEEAQRKAAADTILGNMQARRLGRTYVIAVSYTSKDRLEAATVANAIAESYLLDQLDSKYQSTRRASGWLQERINELRDQSREADLAVQRFRAKNNLLSAGGRLISDQQLGEINSQLILARADTARTKARYDRIRAIIDARQPDAVVTDALEQPVFNDLRSKLIDRSKRAADLAERLGPNHVQVIALRNEMKEYERLIFDELGLIAQGYKSDYEVALSRENSLTDSMRAAMGVTAEANETLVSLRELERQAETLRGLHQSFLNRFEEAVQKQSFPITEARIISRASPPDAPSYPNTSRMVLVSGLLSALCGLAIGMLRERSDTSFRSVTQIRDDLGIEPLGMLPLLDVRNDPPAPGPLPDGSFATPDHLLAPIDKPLSRYTETLRAMKLAVDVQQGRKSGIAIGFTSIFPAEGKSMTAKNFATLLANQGYRTLLIDADLRNPGLTRALCPWTRAGLLDCLKGTASFADTVLREEKSSLAFLPARARSGGGQSGEILASDEMRALLDEASESYDYVCVDLPPTAPVVDVSTAIPLLSGVLFVIEWGATPRAALRDLFEADERLRKSAFGAVLNKVKPDRIGLYEDYGSMSYYGNRYGSYYHQ